MRSSLFALAVLALAVARCSIADTAVLADAIIGPMDASAIDADSVRDAGPDEDVGSSADASDDGGTAFVCTGYDEATCGTIKQCKPLYCDGCDQHVFVACGQADSGPPACPAICFACPANLDEAGCVARTGACHPVYKDPGTCSCPTPGCCMVYDHCSQGQHGICSLPGAQTCMTPPPSCGGDFVPAYEDPGTAMCWDGCVNKRICIYNR